MKIAIDISPLQSGHKVRGVGFYLSYLKKALLEYYPENHYLFFQQDDKLDDSIDLVHYPYFDPFFLTLPFIKKHKMVVTVHDLTPLVFPQHFPAGIKGKLKWQAQRFNLQKVEGVLTDSNASKKDIEKIAGVDSEKVSVAYLAAGEEFKKLPREDASLMYITKKYNLPPEFVLYVGDVTWNKNVPRMLEAIKKINVPIVMVGKAIVTKKIDQNNIWNKDLIKVQRLAEENKKIYLAGFVPTEDLVVLYNLAKAFVFPSVYEGFGLPILEAMQSGCPVIISHESCMPEVGGDAACYFDGYNTESLADTLQNVLSSKELQKELSTKGFEQVKKFNWKLTAEKTIAAYEKVLNP